LEFERVFLTQKLLNLVRGEPFLILFIVVYGLWLDSIMLGELGKKTVTA
jgi:hypothetical protein